MTIRRIVRPRPCRPPSSPRRRRRKRPPVQIPYDRLATRIVDALHLAKGERVLLRYDPATLGPLEPVAAGAADRQGRGRQDAELRPGGGFPGDDSTRRTSTSGCRSGRRRTPRRTAGDPGQVARRRQGPPDPFPLERRHAGSWTAGRRRTRRRSTGSTSTRWTSTTPSCRATRTRSSPSSVPAKCGSPTPVGHGHPLQRRRPSVQQAGRERVEGAHGPGEDPRRSRDRAAGRRAARRPDRVDGQRRPRREVGPAAERRDRHRHPDRDSRTARWSRRPPSPGRRRSTPT